VRLSPVTRRRLRVFRQHRRGFACFWIFLALFGVSLCAELIANDRPLVIRFDGHWYFPVLRNYPETTFGAISALLTSSDPQFGHEMCRFAA